MKKAFLLMTFSVLAFWGFKSAPEVNSNAGVANYYSNLPHAKNYVTPVKKATNVVTDSFTGGTWAPNSIVAESSLGQFWLLYQPDGNLVLYSKFPIYRALWASGPMVSNPQNVNFTPIGLVGAFDTNGIGYWYGNAKSCSNGADYYWVLQDDGNFVCYDTTCGTSKSTRTHGGQYSLNWGSFQ